jgi:hypothetical protein
MSARDKIAEIIMANRAVDNWQGPTPADVDLAAAILAALPDHVRWAAEQWQKEVSNRPMTNIHRRTADDTWRQVIRHHGGDDVFLCGPAHDDLAALNGEAKT